MEKERLRSIGMLVLNSPVDITFSELKIFGIKDEERVEITNEEVFLGAHFPQNDKEILHIADADSKKVVTLAKEGFKIFRTLDVKYKELSRDKEYQYKAEWIYREDKSTSDGTLIREWQQKGKVIAS